VLFLRRPSEVLDWMARGGPPWYHRSESWVKKPPADPQAGASTPPPAPAPGVAPPTHIQRQVIQRLEEVNQALGKSFRFGPGFNSGFIGYENGTVDFGELKGLLSHLYGMLGDAIFRWGAEQTMHGLVLCGRGATPLPTDAYMVYTDLNSDRADAATFVHFIGEFRYHRLKYPVLAARVIRDLTRG
jgi:hypothetical protein